MIEDKICRKGFLFIGLLYTHTYIPIQYSRSAQSQHSTKPVSKAVPYDVYGIQNIVLLYMDLCMCIIFGPLYDASMYRFLCHFFCSLYAKWFVCVLKDKSGGSFCIQLAYKGSHTNLFGAQISMQNSMVQFVNIATMTISHKCFQRIPE